MVSALSPVINNTAANAHERAAQASENVLLILGGGGPAGPLCSVPVVRSTPLRSVRPHQLWRCCCCCRRLRLSHNNCRPYIVVTDPAAASYKSLALRPPARPPARQAKRERVRVISVFSFRRRCKGGESGYRKREFLWPGARAH